MTTTDLTSPRACSTEDLAALMRVSIQRKFNRAIDIDADGLYTKIDFYGPHLIVPVLPYHNGLDAKQGPHHRCQVLIRQSNGSPEPIEVMLDIAHEHFIQLMLARELIAS